MVPSAISTVVFDVKVGAKSLMSDIYTVNVVTDAISNFEVSVTLQNKHSVVDYVHVRGYIQAYACNK